MLRLLQSNQPAAWVIVPLTAAVLVLCRVMGMDAVAWTGESALSAAAGLVTAWWIHRMHFESGMRTRPSLLPSWSWVVLSAPWWFDAPASAWCSMAAAVLALRMALRLRSAAGGGHPCFGWGLALGVATLLHPSGWTLALALVVVVVSFRPLSPGETLSFALGLAAPWGAVQSGLWWAQGSVGFPDWGFHPSTSVQMGRTLWLAPLLIGSAMRVRSFTRATAQQRYARQVTQWWAMVILVATLVGLVVVPGPVAEGPAASGELWIPALAHLGAWSLGWCMPPGWSGSKWVPVALLVTAGTLAFLGG